MCLKTEKELKQAYKQLYDDVTNSDWGQEFVNEATATLTSFTAMQGHKYKDQSIKFMLVGRAPNGWGEKRDLSSAEAFAQFSLASLHNQTDTLSGGKDRFEWIACDTEHPYPQNQYREGVDESPEDFLPGGKCFYRLKRSQFWNYSSQIWAKLNDVDSASDIWQGRWFESILWSDLYKIAPISSGNPTSKLQSIQFDACFNILKNEIKLLKPTHILFATGSWWFEKFKLEFENMSDDISFRYQELAQESSLVEAVGSFTYSNGTLCKFVVAPHPQGKGKRYIEDVFKKLK